MSFPTREDRLACWSARDRYWECLDKNQIKNNINVDNQNLCNELRKLYETSCSKQWVKHFDRKRQYNLFKEKIEKDGYEPLDDRSQQQ